LSRSWKKKIRARYFCFDERGKNFKTSKEFSEWFFSRHDAARHKAINFVIGGAEGFPNPAWKNRYQSISLSNLTLTHQMGTRSTIGANFSKRGD
jgi:23S rRNA pseudoU1915 N3-methylase RlmH